MNPGYTVTYDHTRVDQHEERLTVTHTDGTVEHLRLHEYGRVYSIPGLYEQAVQNRLQCRSPHTVASALADQVRGSGGDLTQLRVLDFGSGNGLVGEELRAHGISGRLIGSDIVPEAAHATRRDRPGLYHEFHTADLASLPVRDLVARHQLNCLTGAGALSHGHVAARSLAAAWDAFPAGAWLAITVQEAIIGQQHGELGDYIAQLRAGDHHTDVTHLERFQHRVRMNGDPIHYYVLVARRLPTA